MNEFLIFFFLFSLAIVTRIRSVPVRRQVYGPAQRGIAGRCLQPIDEDGHHDRRPHQNLALQYHEGNDIHLLGDDE